MVLSRASFSSIILLLQRSGGTTASHKGDPSKLMRCPGEKGRSSVHLLLYHLLLMLCNNSRMFRRFRQRWYV
jgi:hypothetical protein